MKRIVLLISIAFAACSGTKTDPTPVKTIKAPGFTEALAQFPVRSNEDIRASSNALVLQNVGTGIVGVSYGRPGVKGREIFGGLEKWGSVWRAGANEATVFANTVPVKINGQILPVGRYALFMIPNQNSDWVVIFNKIADQWGAFNYQATEDALRINVRPESIPTHEWLSYGFDEISESAARLTMKWEKVQIAFRITL